MSELYRGHEIVVSQETPRSLVIFDRETGTEMPTKVTAMPDEEDMACLRRARELIDLYLEPQQRPSNNNGRNRRRRYGPH